MSSPLIRLSRRAFLRSSACGFGSIALAGLAAEPAPGTSSDPLLHAQGPHYHPRAKRIIFLFMQGGVSQVDSFDYKPLLVKQDGKDMPFDDARVLANSGMKGSEQRIMRPLWAFSRHGESGRWGSALFPELNRHVDDLCFIHSVHTEGVAHGPATLFLHCGATVGVRPSMGAWIQYGLGTENEDLPGFVTIGPSAGNGGARNYGHAFLPAVYQGTAVGKAGAPASDATIRNLSNPLLSPLDQTRHFELLQSLNSKQLKSDSDSELEAVISSFELAWRMQMNAPDVLEISGETKETLDLYGIDQEPTDNFGRQCLLARRLSERGVRFIQVTYGDSTANPAWDQHSNMQAHETHAQRVDRPIAGLLTDLKRRGLLEDTLVWWGSEFGRTPYAQQKGTGRDHNPDGFTIWLAGGGTKAGHAYGSTDDFGHKAVANKVHMHDLHATMLHLLGLDHERLTYRYSGRDFRLTDVHGHVIKEILA
ncbi:DUF1501 domain-containing protein [Tautonia rosea]|uniref:DUF1501 domain-containing protein n=1 Tax=Tautonia rosea TaxID=2728037 RepID=UPI0014752F22|nr:DUF1501 domain-containing protein [Tautonia rosea]